MAEKRYTMGEAARILGIANKTFVNWVNRSGLRETVESQVFEYDQRAHYLTESQLIKLAIDHRHTFIDPTWSPERQEQERRLQHAKEDLDDLRQREKSVFLEMRRPGASDPIPRLEQLIEELEGMLKVLREQRSDGQ